jgi:hypothetical protein
VRCGGKLALVTEFLTKCLQLCCDGERRIADLGTKDAALQVRGVWIIELARV